MGIAMPIAFSCSGCKKKYEVGDQLAGKMGRCKQCGNQFRIPVPRTLAAPPAPKAPPTSDLLDDFDEEDTFPEDDDLMGAEPEEDAAASFGPRASAETPKKKQKKKKSSRAGATGGLANLPLPQMILGGGGTLLVLFLMLVVVPSMRNVENEADAAADPAGQVGEANPAVHAPAPAVADAAPPANAPGAVPNPVAEGPGPGQAPIPVPPAAPLRDRARFQPRMPNRGGNPRLASAGFSPDDEPPPPNADPITLALFQLKSSRTSTVKRGLDALSRMAPDESRKAEVASAIVPLVVSDEGWTAESAVKAIASWPTPEGIQALINAVERDDRFNVRRVAIEKLAALKETSAATAIAGRLRTDGFQATAALRAPRSRGGTGGPPPALQPRRQRTQKRLPDPQGNRRTGDPRHHEGPARRHRYLGSLCRGGYHEDHLRSPGRSTPLDREDSLRCVLRIVERPTTLEVGPGWWVTPCSTRPAKPTSRVISASASFWRSTT